MCDLAASLDDRGRKSLLEDIAATEGESQPALPDKHIQIATRALTNLVLLFSKGSHAVAEELLAAVTGRVLGECVTPKLDQKIVDNLVHTFSTVQTDFGPQTVTLCDVICAAAAPSHRDPKLDVNGFYNKDIDNLRAVADRLGVTVNKMYRGMQRRYTWESLEFGGNFCYVYHPDYRPTNSQAVTEAEKQEIDAAYRSSTISHQSATKKTTMGKRKGPQVPVRYLNASCEETPQKICGKFVAARRCHRGTQTAMRTNNQALSAEGCES